MRRLIILGFTLILLFGQIPVQAQINSLPPEAKATADKLIGLLDSGKYQETYGMVSSIITDSPAMWHGHMKTRREPMGDVQLRTLAETKSVTSFADLPKGSYTRLTFNTDFATQKETAETVVLHQSEDGSWSVVGYELHFNRWPEALKMMGIGLFIVFFIMILLATITWSVGEIIQRTTKKDKAKKEG